MSFLGGVDASPIPSRVRKTRMKMAGLGGGGSQGSHGPTPSSSSSSEAPHPSTSGAPHSQTQNNNIQKDVLPPPTGPSDSAAQAYGRRHMGLKGKFRQLKMRNQGGRKGATSAGAIEKSSDSASASGSHGDDVGHSKVTTTTIASASASAVPSGDVVVVTQEMAVIDNKEGSVSRVQRRKARNMKEKLRSSKGSTSPDPAEDTSPSSPESPSESSMASGDGRRVNKRGGRRDSHRVQHQNARGAGWVDGGLQMQAEEESDVAAEWEKTDKNSRDGFCRRVDSYDGQVITVDGKPTYEVGNYLGGGVAGVVYEGTRLRPVEEYPVRTGVADLSLNVEGGAAGLGDNNSVIDNGPSNDAGTNGTGGGNRSLVFRSRPNGEHDGDIRVTTSDDYGCYNPLCSPLSAREVLNETEATARVRSKGSGVAGPDTQISSRTPSRNTRSTSSGASGITNPQAPRVGRAGVAMDVAIEIPKSPTGFSDEGKEVVVLDEIDAPSRSKAYARAASEHAEHFFPGEDGGLDNSRMSEGAASGGIIMDETVAVKILNPVGFRLLSPSAAQGAVVVKEGEPMEPSVINGIRPMRAEHVWWLVNPNSRNLRTLQKQSSPVVVNGHENGSSHHKTMPGDYIDRGSPERGLRLSLVAAYVDPRSNTLRELSLTKCIEIWGHAPFDCTEEEFNALMDAIERVNAGHSPNEGQSSDRSMGRPSSPHRVTTGMTTTSSLSNVSAHFNAMNMTGLGTLRQSNFQNGLLRATLARRETVYCPPLNAYIAVPTVPPKYLRWLRQRRAATKEIRNMTRIGRHRNVVHLYEVLELIQDSKSTMFLILELVTGGELFDLISSKPAAKGNQVGDDDPEKTMLKFFRELASGIAYCHFNGIAHRDLKPENLLVHNDTDGECTLKIADFGLSATFTIANTVNEIDALSESYMSPPGTPHDNSVAQGAEGVSPAFSSHEHDGFSNPILKPLSASVTTALSYLTCGSIEQVACIPLDGSDTGSKLANPLRRMTSIVGSPHYVAPEIISQSDNRDDSGNKGKGSEHQAGKKGTSGYDGTKADVWSAGVILYAMLFRSLPFGEDLLRCPRYQSYNKWFEEARRHGGRRSQGSRALLPTFDERDEEEMLGPHWFFPAETSLESRDLIVAMLNPDPFERLSIDMVLRHPWLTRGHDSVQRR